MSPPRAGLFTTCSAAGACSEVMPTYLRITGFAHAIGDPDAVIGGRGKALVIIRIIHFVVLKIRGHAGHERKVAAVEAPLDLKTAYLFIGGDGP